MEEPLNKREEEEEGDERKERDAEVLSGNMSRKEKRKAMKKMKRKQTRKEMAAKEREEEEARLNDPEELRRIQLMEQEEAERIQRERMEFEERERAWIEAMEMKKKKAAEEQEQRKLREESHKQQREKENEFNQDDEWEYVEEGPAEIIWQGNEIIFKKKKVRVPKKDSGQQNNIEDADRPTSNPLPPASEIFADYTNSLTVSAQQMLENVAQHVPKFGTEQDKAHCPFHLKTGACRFGQRCSRVHFYPDQSCTLLMKNMYNGPGLAWEQDEGLEYMDEEIERCFEEFYDDVHTEFLKFGEIVNFKVCKNGSFHLRGNVYVQYKSLDSAILAYNSVNGRYFAGKQVSCKFVNLTRWKVAICGEYVKSGFKTCSHGTVCNFIHCFRNPGGDYEWADSDKSPPKCWVKKMAALFGYSDDNENLMKQENLSVLKSSSKWSKTDSDRHHSRRSRSREIYQLNSGHSCRRKHEDERRQRTPDEEWNANLKDNYKRKGRTPETISDGECSNKEEDREMHYKRTRKSSSKRNKDDNSRSREEDSDVDWATTPRDREKWHSREGRNSRKWNKDSKDWIYEAGSDEDRDRKSNHISKRKSSRDQGRDNSNETSEAESDKGFYDRGDMEIRHDSSRKSSRHSRSGLQDDYKDNENENEVERGWSRWESDRQAHRYRKQKRSKHQKKLEYIDGYRDSKNVSQESGEWSGEDSSGDRHHKSKGRDNTP